ncbi:MAG: DUF2160 domain-containing protein [Geminicoccaceae bacterium]
MDLLWMAWTSQTATIFVIIALLLTGMTVHGVLYPPSGRIGILGFRTTPGDRLFISLLGSAYIHLAWLAFFGEPLWAALGVSLLWAAAVFRLV